MGMKDLVKKAFRETVDFVPRKTGGPFGNSSGCSKFPPARPQEAGRLRRTLGVRRREARARERSWREFSAADYGRPSVRMKFSIVVV